MISLNHDIVIPLGCSCMGQFQLNRFIARSGTTGRSSGSLFDWTIATPDATVAVLEAIADGSALRLLTDRKNYAAERGHLINREFEGLYFWHERAGQILGNDPSFFADFAAKLKHQLDNLQQDPAGKRRHLLWTNLQPNLQMATAHLDADWSRFVLSPERLAGLRAAVVRVFGPESNLLICLRAEDASPDLRHSPEIRFLELDRSADFHGPDGLFDDMIAGLTAQ